jgi:S-formylglutathione hydrolase FrmB
MAYELSDSQVVLSIAAGADLSAKQYTFVKLSGTTVISAAAATDIPVGVLLNDPASGETAAVAVSGLVKLKASAAIAVGALVGTTSTGTAVTLVAGTDTTKFILGRAITVAGATGDIITVAINCAAPARAA